MPRYTDAEQQVAATLVVGLLAMGKDNPRIRKSMGSTLSIAELAVDMYEECLTALETRGMERQRHSQPTGDGSSVVAGNG
jgi:hypothetical protein